MQSRTGGETEAGRTENAQSGRDLEEIRRETVCSLSYESTFILPCGKKECSGETVRASKRASPAILMQSTALLQPV